MLTQQKQAPWEGVLHAIQHSYAIKRHADFFSWLKQDIHPLMRHDILLATWGNFNTGELGFDVTSSLPDVTTQRLLQDSAIVNYLMCNLYKRWLENDEKWYVVNRFDASGIHSQSPNPFTQQLIKMHSLLVYGVRDTRRQADCIYVFFDRTREFHVPDQLLGMIMPHLDAAIRRIEHLKPIVKDEDLLDTMAQGSLSDREQEILHWVRSGKTNLEIGMILNISANTVKNHLKRIFQKLDVSCRAQAVAKTGVFSGMPKPS
ncbi:transcriptional regulator EpsA [Methylophilus rhizosphaerae]|uniref:Transcriptional regulator EpsA n=1 Tax=Methylophilus rhizosphaerae TaxID=492660 RepID=A0A1G8ZJY3_9PROT|nr:XrtB/PEP-CTERM-associated transcriptional regulator EpsA [Methylophilus rhizosphaerae]SDK15333.1 transcriptional regulator EpsA [Methylophilus rhizosphaerae]